MAKKKSKITRKFNGHRYKYYFFYYDPNNADDRAKELRKEGWLVRLIKKKDSFGKRYWELYRKKGKK